MEMEKSEQDLVILSQLQLFRRDQCLEGEYAKQVVKNKSRFSHGSMTRQDVQYRFLDVPICRRMYLFLHNVGETRFKNLIKHFDKFGIASRVHGSTRKTPARDNVFTPTDVEKVVCFIKALAEKTAISLPGRLPQFKDFTVMKLPSSETKMSVYRKYKNAVTLEPQIKTVGESSFYKIWAKYCPYITTMRPANDLCETCRQNSMNISRCANFSEDIKSTTLNDALEHLNRAKIQRNYYNSWREKAKTVNMIELQNGVSSSFAVVSFDFAEGVHYPSSPQQVGQAYFRTARKCSIFGIHDEKTNIQTNFLVDEEDSIGKGANVIVSFLDYYLSKLKADVLIFFADNCVGQNKNNTVVQYLLWRVLTKKNKKIHLNFLLAGHTKFSPDRNFGLLKSNYARSNIDCIQDLICCVHSSSPNGFNIAVPTVDPETKRRNVVWSDWNQFLSAFFKPFVGITSYHHFIFEQSGSLAVKLFADSEPEMIHLQKSSLETTNAMLIEDILPDGLSVERQWYLYEQIRDLCQDDAKKDLVAPKPRISKGKVIHKRKATSKK